MSSLEPQPNFPPDPLWYKDAAVYQLHVRAFYDSNGDGIGDFPGLTQKLPYLKDLGITAVWLLPFYPSPLKDDGYDIADYYGINPMYGTLRDFKEFLSEAHALGLRVITELVVNHTSDQHRWFQKSRNAPPGSHWRNFYVWSDSPAKYEGTRIIFRDFETSNWTWDPAAGAYFWHRFYSHQPDLNFDNPAVHRELKRVLDFWLDLGVDGLRLDAVPYLYEREGTSCENLPETHQYLKTLRRHVDSKYGDRMLLAEANQWPEDAVSYFGSGSGDECHMAFHFPLMPRLFMAVRMEDRFPIVDILDQTPPIPETSQWGLFLRNHDELTLEMVTDEERDYMYQVYAAEAKARINLGIRRRLAPLLGNDRKRIELLHFLLFSFPGTPFLYYGDEIGMGDNIYLGDRNGVRTPMQWSSDKNAGFSRANPHALYLPIILEPEYHYEAINVETQRQNLHSFWWWMKRTLSLRRRYQAFSRGRLRLLHPENRRVLAFVREREDEHILVIANLSRFGQAARLDLSAYEGRVPLELFGRTAFPRISAEPYLLSLSPHGAFWFLLKSTQAAPAAALETTPPIQIPGPWTAVLDRWNELEKPLLEYIRARRWFGGKGKEVRSLSLEDRVPLRVSADSECVLALLTIDYVQDDPERYLLPLDFAPENAVESLQKASPQSVITRLMVGGQSGVLYDCSTQEAFGRALFLLISRRRVLRSGSGKLSGHSLLPREQLETASDQAITPGTAEQSNTSIRVGQSFLLKLYRKLAPGVHPDVEVTQYLTESGFAHTAALAGHLEYQKANQSIALGIMTRFSPGSLDAWEYTLDVLGRFFERAAAFTGAPEAALPPVNSLLVDARGPLPDRVLPLLGTYVESARLLGQRTAELHLALGAETANRDFAPEPFTLFYQRSLFQSLRNLTVRNLSMLKERLEQVPPAARPCAAELLQQQGSIMERLRQIHSSPITAKRIRGHGDFHLGQVLYTGKDFIIVDFEGEPARRLGERRIKKPALRDVAGMLRSFEYATRSGLLQQRERGAVTDDQMPKLIPWAQAWTHWAGVVFLQAYLQHVTPAGLLPRRDEDLRILLEVLLLEKAIYELGYELNNRPTWVGIPCEGIMNLIARKAKE